MTKPLAQAELLTRIQTHLTIRKQEKELRQALTEAKTLSGILPICSYCKKIRNDRGEWQHIEEYIPEPRDAFFSHGLCTGYYQRKIHILNAN